MAQPLSPLRWLALPLSLALLAGSGAAHADEEDHERARKALEAGEVLPLKTILERVERACLGQVMDVGLERDHAGCGALPTALRVSAVMTAATTHADSAITREGMHGLAPARSPPLSERCDAQRVDGVTGQWSSCGQRCGH